MKPIEIFEYKQKWLPGFTVRLHSDLRSAAVDWLKTRLSKEQYDYTQHSDVYEDTVHFEDQRISQVFESDPIFIRWVNR